MPSRAPESLPNVAAERHPAHHLGLPSRLGRARTSAGPPSAIPGGSRQKQEAGNALEVVALAEVVECEVGEGVGEVRSDPRVDVWIAQVTEAELDRPLEAPEQQPGTIRERPLPSLLHQFAQIARHAGGGPRV